MNTHFESVAEENSFGIVEVVGVVDACNRNMHELPGTLMPSPRSDRSAA